MPHSTISDPAVSTPTAEDDSILPDAPLQALGDVKEEEDSEGSAGEAGQTNATSKPDVKLEDLFNDDDESDEEFPSSSIPNGEPESSPPAAPV